MADLLARVIPQNRSALARYGLTLVGLAIAAAVTYAGREHLARTIFIVFWPVVIGAAWFGGLGPAVFASVASILVVDYLLIPPTGTLRPATIDDVLPLVIFLLVTAVISSLVHAARQERARALDEAALASASAHQMDVQSKQLAHQLEESQSLSEELEQTAEELEERSAVAEDADRFSRSIVESISDPFVVFDADWRFQFINGAASKVFARSGRTELIGQVVWEVYPQLVGTTFQKNMLKASDERRPVSFEAWYATGAEWSATFCYPLPSGGIAAQWQNITERKRSEETSHYLTIATATLGSSLDYEDTLARLAGLLVPQLGDWCAVHLLEGDDLKQVAVGHIDPARVDYARALNTRYPSERDAPTGAPNVVRTGVAEVYSDITDEMLVQGAVDAEHLEITRSLNIRSALIAPMLTQSGVIGAITLIGADSGRRYTQADVPLVQEIGRRAALAVENARHHRSALEAREHAEAMQQEAEAANIAKTQFLTSMSHELRTPLNAIAGYADLMSLGIHGEVTEAQQEDLERIKRNQRHLLGIINDILNYARLDAGRVAFEISNVTAFDVVDELQPMIRPQLAGRNLHFHSEAIDRSIHVSADREKLRQVLINLLSNAIKFTPPGGHITLECREDGDRIAFIVTDTGIGIPPEKLEAIFEPFVQIDRSLAQPVEGTGLGLSISREMVEGMQGTLTATSGIGVGSVFTVSLPRAS